jgi:hypothetical protein
LFSVPRTGDLEAGAAHINPEGTGAVSQSVSPLGAPIGGSGARPSHSVFIAERDDEVEEWSPTQITQIWARTIRDH